MNWFLRAKLQENCDLSRNILISEYIIIPNGGYCVYYLSNIFRKTQDLLKIREYQLDIPQFWLGHIQLHDVLRPIITCKQIYLRDFNVGYSVSEG